MSQLFHAETNKLKSIPDFINSLPYGVEFTPTTISEYGYEVVFDVPKPQKDKLFTVTEVLPVRATKGFLEQTWEVVDTHATMQLSQQEFTLAAAKEERLAEVALLRWTKETGGMTLPDGTRVKTDEVSQGKIHAALTGLTNGFDTVITFKSDSGTVLLGLPEITILSKAVWTYVQMCFTVEADLIEQINLCVDPHAVYALDINTGWPSNNLVPPALPPAP